MKVGKYHHIRQGRCLRITAALLLLLGISRLTAQSLIEIHATVDRNAITIGDRIVYQLIIDRQADLQIRTPGQGANLGHFEIKDYRVEEPQQLNGRVRQVFEYTISVFDTGSYVIPPFPVAFAAADSQMHYIASEPLTIRVESILKQGDAQLRDIKPPFNLPADWLPWIIALGALLLTGLLAWLAWRYHRSRQGNSPVFRKEVLRPAHEIALEELQTLLASGLLEQGQYKSFHTVLSDILRRYIENRFYIKALEETTSELLMSLREAAVPADEVALAAEALGNCDMVKFARHIPSEQMSREATGLVRGFIEQTRLEFQPVEKLVEEDANDREE